MAGWVKVYRQLKDKAYYKDSEFVHLWLHLLLCANHDSAEFLNGYEIVKLKKGQFITGRKKLSLETGISESKIERILKVFESEQQIEQQTNSRNRLISIVSWEKYQQSEQQMDSKRTASGQQVDTNNNDKNNKEVIISCFSFDEFWNAYPNKVAKSKCESKYKNLSENDREQIKNTLQSFLAYKPFADYRHPNPETYLNQKRWQDVIPQQTKIEPNQESEKDYARRMWIERNMG